MEIAVLVGAKVIIGYSALTIGNWETSNPLPKERTEEYEPSQASASRLQSEVGDRDRGDVTESMFV